MKFTCCSLNFHVINIFSNYYFYKIGKKKCTKQSWIVKGTFYIYSL